MNFHINPFTGEFEQSVDPLYSPFVFFASCEAEVIVGVCVRIEETSIDGNIKVSKADRSNPIKMPCVGVVIRKHSTLSCSVCYLGGIRGVFLPSKVYYVGDSSTLTSTVPSTPGMLQRIGIAISDSIFLIKPSLDMIRVTI